MKILDVFARKKNIFNRPYLIAEVGVNHECDIELAKDLIRQAAAGGAVVRRRQPGRRLLVQEGGRVRRRPAHRARARHARHAAVVAPPVVTLHAAVPRALLDFENVLLLLFTSYFQVLFGRVILSSSSSFFEV